MKKIGEILGGIALAGVAIVGLVGLTFGAGKVENIYDKTIGKERVSIQREKFKESSSYVEGMINSLSEYKSEYEVAETKEEKEQIKKFIDSKFSNFDINLIENQTLYKFLSDIREGRI